LIELYSEVYFIIVMIICWPCVGKYVVCDGNLKN
jgi:hypothetical protein